MSSKVDLTTALYNFDTQEKTQFKNTGTEASKLQKKVNAVLEKQKEVSDTQANSVINAGYSDSIDDIFS